MASRKSQIFIPVRSPSFDGKYWGRYPQGDKPLNFTANAVDQAAASGALSTQIKLGGSALDVSSAVAAITTQKRLAAAAVVQASSTASLNSGSNVLTHGQEFIINGSGFGSATPDTLFDNGDAGDGVYDGQWDGGFPDQATNILYNLKNRAAPFRGINPPHSRMTNFLAGCHNGAGPHTGTIVTAFRTYTKPAPVWYSFWRLWYLIDPSWVFSSTNNYKLFGFSNDPGSPLTVMNWYIEHLSPFTNKTATSTNWHVNDDVRDANQSLQGTPPSFNEWYMGSAINPFNASAGWTPLELLIKYTSGSDGYINLWEKRVLSDYTGRTDNYSGTTRCEGMGLYSGTNPNANNWRMMGGILNQRGLDPGRIYLSTGTTMSSAIPRLAQRITSQTPTQIKFRVDAGDFANGDIKVNYVNEVTGNQMNLVPNATLAG